MNKTKKILFGILISFICLLTNAEALDNEYGIYCAYQDNAYFIYSGSNTEDKFNIDTNFDEIGILIESDRPGKAFSTSDEQSWLKAKGLIDSNNNFVCPQNPFGANIGEAKEKECGTKGCSITTVESPYENYTCNYRGQDSNKTLTISYTLSKEYSSGKWDISYPDGTNKSLIGTQISGNFMPGSNCDDILFIANNNNFKIQVINSNSPDAYMKTLCSISGNDVEHFCQNDRCNSERLSCDLDSSEDGDGCPTELRAIVVFLKRVVFNTLQIFVPILLILMGTIDFAKAVASPDDKGNKEAISKFIKRCLAAVMIFFISTIVLIVMNMFSKTDIGEKNDWNSCWTSIK